MFTDIRIGGIAGISGTDNPTTTSTSTVRLRSQWLINVSCTIIRVDNATHGQRTIMMKFVFDKNRSVLDERSTKQSVMCDDTCRGEWTLRAKKPVLKNVHF